MKNSFRKDSLLKKVEVGGLSGILTGMIYAPIFATTIAPKINSIHISLGTQLTSVGSAEEAITNALAKGACYAIGMGVAGLGLFMGAYKAIGLGFDYLDKKPETATQE